MNLLPDIPTGIYLGVLLGAFCLGFSKTGFPGLAMLNATIDDMRGMAWLGRYYADKIRAAVALATFESTGKQSDKDNAVRYIRAAYEDCTR